VSVEAPPKTQGDVPRISDGDERVVHRESGHQERRNERRECADRDPEGRRYQWRQSVSNPWHHAEKYVHTPSSFYDSISPAPESPDASDNRPDKTDRMRLEIVVAPHPSDIESAVPPLPIAADGGGRIPRRERGRHARDVLDIFIDGANVTARVRETHGAFVLRDLALSLVELSHRPRAKATIRFYDEPWELCVERFGATACLSVYRSGPNPFVVVYDRAVPFDDMVAAARDAIDRLVLRGNALAAGGARMDLVSAAAQLEAVAPTVLCDDVRVPEAARVVIEPDADAPVSFGAEFGMREGAPSPELGASQQLNRTETPAAYEAVERADMHALLFRGRVRAEIRGRTVDLGECHPLFVAETLVDLARRAFEAWERGLPLALQSDATGVLVGVQVTPDGKLALTLGAAQTKARRAVHTFPALGVTDMLEGALAFGRTLVRAILRRDRAQSHNLRLSALRRTLRESTEALREASQVDSKVNSAPEPYRAYAATLDDARPAPSGSPTPTRLRYAPRWRAVVPGLDLRGTYLCGDRLVVGAAGEMWALDRTTGRTLWRADVARGTSFVTPGGVARLAANGMLTVYDFGTGEPALRTQIAPRFGSVAGAVVHLPGLPKIVVVTEGEHHLVAIDLTSGEPRWRWSWGTGRGSIRETGRGVPRMKRAGRLIYFTFGDGTLTALDVLSGAVVWRIRDRLRFRVPPTVAHDALFAVAGGAHGTASLYSIDPYSGRVNWSTPVADANAPCTVEGPPLATAGSVAVAVRHKSGLALAAFHRADGKPIDGRGSRASVVAPSGTSWLAVDDVFIGNAASGELVAVDAASGELRWRHVLGPRPLEADVPRRLEPVLRCGALFVPCSFVSVDRGDGAAAGVAILRPSDGRVLGTIAPTEVIPDLLRVDERCDVYVAEESGHLAAFGALPRLSLVAPAS
jgi:outer membrane protein assembly factor BamB